MSSKTIRYTQLPEELINDLKSLKLSKKQFEHAVKFIDIVKNKSYNNHQIYTSLVELPRAYLTEVFNSRLYEWLNPLKECGIIITENSYSTITKTSKSYSINNKYYSSSLLTNSTLLTYMCSHSIGDESEEKEYTDIRDKVTEDLKQLIINTDRLNEIIAEKINKLTINDFAVNEQITEEIVYIQFNGSNKKYKYTKAKAIFQAGTEGKSLIQDKRKFWIMNEKEFIDIKRIALYNSYTEAAGKLDRGYYFANRNKTNNRLDSNITNLSNELMDQICIDNKLVQIDLANSQFAILSHLLKDKLNAGDYGLFNDLSASGRLYEYLQEQLGLKSRKLAKVLMFQLLFSHENNPTKCKAKLKQLFPSVVKWIDDYKRTHGHKLFPIMLQKEESVIFIDNLWKNLKGAGLFCLTKHDSLIVKAEDKARVLEYVENYFNRIGFECRVVTKDIVEETPAIVEEVPVEVEVLVAAPYSYETLRHRGNLTKEELDYLMNCPEMHAEMAKSCEEMLARIEERKIRRMQKERAT